MNIVVAEFICVLLCLLFVGFIFCLFVKFNRSLLSVITSVIISLAIGIVGIILIDKLTDKVKEDYRCIDQITTYKIYNISFDNKYVIIHYIDDNKEVKHIKSDKVKIYYDLNEEHEPYAVRNQYWRWFLYWEELEVHIRE